MSSQNVPKMNSKAPSFKLKRHLKIKKEKRAKRMAGSICSSGIIRENTENQLLLTKKSRWRKNKWDLWKRWQSSISETE